MNFTSFLKTAATAAVCLGIVAAAAEAQDRVRWKMHSAFASKLPVLGYAGKRMEKSIAEVTNGSFQWKFFEPGALVPGIAYYDPVAQGSIDIGYGTAGYGVGKAPSLAFFTAVPFGPGFSEFHGWMQFGGGQAIYDEINASIGLKGQICATIPPESSGWFRNEIKSLDDFKGMKMRFFGLGAKVMEKFGVSTQLLAGGDIYPALELGSIDATEFSMPSIDEGLGFFQVAKHYYFPGWHQPVSLGDVIMAPAAYEGLSQYHKDAMRIMCGYQIYMEYVEGDATQGPAMSRMIAKGVTAHSWSPEILEKLETTWKEVAAAEAQADPLFKKAWESLQEWRTQYAVWKEKGYLN